MSAVYTYPPYNRFVAVTPSDTVNFVTPPDAIYVGGAGAIVVVNGDDSTSTIGAVPAGTTLPITCKRINSSSTTATSIVALYRV